jgi:hypothetical protein
MRDVIACGELLIDFVSTESGVTLAQAPAFKKAAGGAPAERLTTTCIAPDFWARSTTTGHWRSHRQPVDVAA